MPSIAILASDLAGPSAPAPNPEHSVPAPIPSPPKLSVKVRMKRPVHPTSMTPTKRQRSLEPVPSQEEEPLFLTRGSDVEMPPQEGSDEEVDEDDSKDTDEGDSCVDEIIASDQASLTNASPVAGPSVAPQSQPALQYDDEGHVVYVPVSSNCSILLWILTHMLYSFFRAIRAPMQAGSLVFFSKE